MTQKNIIVTGANIGIGLATVISLLRQYENQIGTIIMACRNEEKASEAIKQVQKELPKADISKIKYLHMDLNDLKGFELV